MRTSKKVIHFWKARIPFTNLGTWAKPIQTQHKTSAATVNRNQLTLLSIHQPDRQKLPIGDGLQIAYYCGSWGVHGAGYDLVVVDVFDGQGETPQADTGTKYSLIRVT